MQKINFILFLLIISTGCSVIRRGVDRNYGLSNEIIASRLLESINKQNITKNNFYILKAELNISSSNRTEKLIGSLKFENPDKFLISIRTITGIEAARIFISDDTILINDRINRKQYYGSSKYLEKKYGLTAAGLPVILGDYIDDNIYNINQEKCSEGKMNIDGVVNGLRIKYIIDCRKGKTILAITQSSMNEGGFEIRYSDFLENGYVLTPGRIEIRDLRSMTTIEIKIRKIESPWNGNIEFIPGNRYEKIQLL